MRPNQRLHDTIVEQTDIFPHALVEIGTDAGTSAMWTLEALKGKKNWFHTIDPHGDKPYNIGGNLHTTFLYGDEKYRETYSKLAQYASENEVNHCYWKMRSQDWIAMWDNVEFWSEGREQDKQFCYAFLDGEHAWEPVMLEFDYFYNHMPEGGVIVIDDYNLLGSGPEGHIGKYQGSYELFDEDDNYRIYFRK